MSFFGDLGAVSMQWPKAHGTVECAGADEVVSVVEHQGVQA